MTEVDLKWKKNFLFTAFLELDKNEDLTIVFKEFQLYMSSSLMIYTCTCLLSVSRLPSLSTHH